MGLVLRNRLNFLRTHDMQAFQKMKMDSNARRERSRRQVKNKIIDLYKKKIFT